MLLSFFADFSFFLWSEAVNQTYQIFAVGQLHSPMNLLHTKYGMDGTGLKFESWKVENYTKNASQYSSHCSLKEIWSWNPAGEGKVPPMILFVELAPLVVTTDWSQFSELYCVKQFTSVLPAIVLRYWHKKKMDDPDSDLGHHDL